VLAPAKVRKPASAAFFTRPLIFSSSFMFATRKPLSLRRKAYKKVAFTVPNDRRLRFSTAFSGGAKQKRPRPQQGAFRTSSPFV
jgi:hypothetical protein